jgi:hypothetical protein
MIHNKKHIILTLLLSLTFILTNFSFAITKDKCEYNKVNENCDCIYEHKESHKENHNVYEDQNCCFPQAFELNNSIVLYENNKELSKRENNYKVLFNTTVYEYEEIILKNILTLSQDNYKVPQRDIPILNSSFLI